MTIRPVDPQLLQLASVGLEEELVTLLGGPIALIEIGGSLDVRVVRDVLPRLASAPIVIVATLPHGRVPEWDDVLPLFDVIIAERTIADPPADAVVPPEGLERALASLAEQVESHPLASVSLALLLHGAARRSIDDGLVAESAVYSMLQAGPEFVRWRAAHPRRSRTEVAGPQVLVRRDAGTLTVTLNRPALHNAFSARMREELADALSIAESDGTVSKVVVRGAGPSFCSGGDLDEFGTFPDPATAHVARLARSPARHLARLRERVEVRLHGHAIGAGIELSAFAGHVVAHPETSISLPEVSLGLVPGAGGTVSLPRRIGRHRTTYMALTGCRLDATAAASWGLIDDIATEADGYAAARTSSDQRA